MYSGCLVTSAYVMLNRSVGLDWGQKLKGVPPGTSLRWKLRDEVG